ncbi:hypothetical protein COV24_04665 [candidate division WWE3 bacterium CG10_big_fil_rev_8_21_14_0_10_32_10]|uniref:t-SNARE coiled-coil homology domain-containing protein n=1 Tax=candidate division WWE3 bacterium CG10_big_fil_rev_8_21_14_0_10_32_10 TaxID=1975090 RepID=A0A2H0RAP2_UNCKA|nr:MAG: hypothetical protein COV24_04665 [candidate division WWE3 bacterium CG10_big_fil_rev_8_21_14_0_10_32_10]
MLSNKDLEKINILLEKRLDEKFESKLEPIKVDINNIKSDLKPMKLDIQNIKSDMEPMKLGINNMKAELGPIKEDIKSIKSDMEPMKKDISKINKNLDSVIRYFDSDVTKNTHRISRIEIFLKLPPYDPKF